MSRQLWLHQYTGRSREHLLPAPVPCAELEAIAARASSDPVSGSHRPPLCDAVTPLQVDTADELMTVELMFNAVWRKLDKHKLIALLSCLIPCTEGSEEEAGLPIDLADAVNTLQAFAAEIANVSIVRSPAWLPSPRTRVLLSPTARVTDMSVVSTPCSCCGRCRLGTYTMRVTL